MDLSGRYGSARAVPTIDTAVTMRDLSAYKDQRVEAAKYLSAAVPSFEGPKQAFVGLLRNALFARRHNHLCTGMALLKAASEGYHYGLKLHDVAAFGAAGASFEPVS